MTSSPARGSTTSVSSTTKSLLARLKSPLQSKTRNFTDFYIQPDDPHRQYSPGDLISGSVVLRVIKPLRITHLVVSLHGYAQVFKNPNSPGDAYRNYSATVAHGKGKRGGNYFGNGFASLFEDEVVLCGEGRLGEGVYHFNFELEFPSKGLPSSIDFERGTISYMLASTLTRSTTISPTTSCDTKVFLMDVIDVAPIPVPKSQIISLKPVSRRGRNKGNVRRPNNIIDTTHHGPENPEHTRTGRVSELNSLAEESDTPGSPAQSDVSFESRISSGGGSGTEFGVRSVHATTEGSCATGSRTAPQEKSITATVDVLKGGFLRGDQIPIKISVSHTKHVRSLKGIIITLYRQARVDMHPAVPVAPNSKGDKTQSEEYYPKSRTGLGGLSLSSSGSSHTFRKDLSQTFAPLFVDPRTLTAEIKCAVRVPDEAFPTISNVPGAMISFRYFIEVVVDIQGKLTGLDRMIPNAGLVSIPSGYGNAGEDTGGGMFSTWGGNFVDTDAIRREKGVVTCMFEVVIGTKDSEKNGKRKQQMPEPAAPRQSNVHDIPLAPTEDAYPSDPAGQSYYDYAQAGNYFYQDDYGDGCAPDYEQGGYQGGEASQSAYGLPQPEDESGLPEKERLRRAEERLLPSRPPDADEPSSPSIRSRPPTLSHGLLPSAPVLPDDGDLNPQYDWRDPSSSSQHPPPFAASSFSHPSQTRDDDIRTTAGTSTTVDADQHPSASSNSLATHRGISQLPSSSAPGYSASSYHVPPTDDKQELQRRRLEMERSAPPDEPEDDDALSRPSAPPASDVQHLGLAPSAPVLDDDDEGLVGPVGAASNQSRNRRVIEALPVYERVETNSRPAAEHRR